MPRRSSAVHIPMPCAESWDAMTPTGPGRHCATCQKVVVDFSQKTDSEILAILAKAVGGETCGRFRAEQLAVALVPPASASRWRTWLGAVLTVGGVLGASRAVAQTDGNYYSGGPMPKLASSGSTVAATVPLVTEATLATPAKPGEPLILKGVVTDAKTGEHLPGVTVLLKGTQQGISTDKDGQFALQILAGNVATTTLAFSYIGYIHEEVPAARVAAMPVVAIQISSQVLGGLEVIYVQKPYPWHPRSFFNWGKYWLTKPFRS